MAHFAGRIEPLRPRRCIGFRLRIDQHARGWPPQGPNAEHAHGKAGFQRQHRQRVASALRRFPIQVHQAGGVGLHPDPAKVFVPLHRQAQAPACLHAWVVKLHLQAGRCVQKMRLWRQQPQMQSAQIGMAHVHAHDRCPSEQKGQHIAHVQLKIDRGHQHA